MRIFLGVMLAGVLMGSYVVCPTALRSSIAETVTPDAETLADIDRAMTALMGHLEGPGDLNPNAPAV